MANIRIAVNREPNNANYQSAYNSIRQGINPMGFGFDPFSFVDFSAYTAGAGNTGTRRQQSRPVRRQGGCLLTILRIALAIFIIRLVILGITSLVSWSSQYQHYDVSPGNAYSYSQSADGNQSNDQNDAKANDPKRKRSIWLQQRSKRQQRLWSGPRFRCRRITVKSLKGQSGL